MSRTRRYRGQDRRNFYVYDSSRQDPLTISVYRPVTVDEQLERQVPLVQKYIKDTLEQNDIYNGVHRVALQGLRVTLLRTREHRIIYSRNNRLNSLTAVQRAINQSLVHSAETVENISGSRGLVVRGRTSSSVTLAFTSPSLMAEQEAIYETIHERHNPSVHAPLLTLYTVPDLHAALALTLSSGLSSIAHLVNVSLGPLAFDIRE